MVIDHLSRGSLFVEDPMATLIRSPSSFFRPYGKPSDEESPALLVFKLDPQEILEILAEREVEAAAEAAEVAEAAEAAEAEEAAAAEGCQVEKEEKEEEVMGSRSPMLALLTKGIAETYKLCNPDFKLADPIKPPSDPTSPSENGESGGEKFNRATTTPEEVYNAVMQNQGRYLTTPSEGVFNGGLDNQENDFILYIGCILENSASNNRYVVKSKLGQGAYGQVCRCSTSDPNWEGDVAVKVVKNLLAYSKQALVEIGICLHLRRFVSCDDYHIYRILDHFEFAGHVCLVFEVLGRSLYELLKFNKHNGLPMELVRRFTYQMLEALIALEDARVIHGDLKPENILLQPCVKNAEIKLIDFGSSWRESPGCRYRCSYIQSRYYRSPEVLLRMSYGGAMDMWSLGCIAAELFLGIPIFPGECEYDVLRFMIEVLGEQPPDHMIQVHHSNKANFRFFKLTTSAPISTKDGGQSSAYQLLSNAEIAVREKDRQGACREWGKSKIGRRRFGNKKLADIIMDYPVRRTMAEEEEVEYRLSFADILRGVLHLDPTKRWTPRQALLHPFMTGQPRPAPFQPPPDQICADTLQQGMMLGYNANTGQWFAPSPHVPQGWAPHPPNLLHHSPTGPYNNGSNHSTSSNGVYGDGHGFGSTNFDVFVNGTGLGTSPGSYGYFPAPLSRLGPYANGPGPGRSPWSYEESTTGMPYLHPNTPGSAVNDPHQGGCFGQDLTGIGGGLLTPDIYHQRMNMANAQAYGEASPSNVQLVQFGGTPSFHLQPNLIFNLYPSPISSTFTSPHSASFGPSPWHTPSPGSAFYVSPNSQLSPCQSLFRNSPSVFGHASSYRVGGSAAQNIPYPMVRQRQHGPQWSSNPNPSTSNGNDSSVRGPAHHGSSCPPRYRNTPGMTHFAPTASSSSTGLDNTLGAMLRLPDFHHEGYGPPPASGDQVHGYSDGQLLQSPREASSSSTVPAMDVNEVSDRIAHLRTRPY